MPLPFERQKKLDPILESLLKVPGVHCVQPDDFNRTSVEVHIYLAGNKYCFDQRLQDSKRRIRKVVRSHGFVPMFVGIPVKTRVKGEDLGYDRMFLTLDINL